MDRIPITQYKGCNIEFAVDSGEFTAQWDGSSVGWFDTLKSIEEKINRVIKANIKTSGVFPISAYKLNGYELKKGKITSINLEEKNGWFVADNGDRQKVESYAYLYPCNDNNNALAIQLESIRKTIRQANEEAKLLTQRLTDRIDFEKVDYAKDTNRS